MAPDRSDYDKVIKKHVNEIYTLSTILENQFADALRTVKSYYKSLESDFESYMNTYIDQRLRSNDVDDEEEIYLEEKKQRGLSKIRDQKLDTMNYIKNKNIQSHPAKAITQARNLCDTWNNVDIMHSNDYSDVDFIKRGINFLISKKEELDDVLKHAEQIIFDGRALSLFRRAADETIAPKLYWHEWWDVVEYKTIFLNQSSSFLTNDLQIDKDIRIRGVTKDIYFCLYSKKNHGTTHYTPHVGLYSLRENRMIIEQPVHMNLDIFLLSKIHVFREFIVMVSPNTGERGDLGYIHIRLYRLTNNNLEHVAARNHEISDLGRGLLEHVIGGICANSDYIMIYLNYQSNRPINVFNWDLKYIKNVGGQAGLTEVLWFGCTNNCFIEQSGSTVKVMDQNTGQILTSFYIFNKILDLDKDFNIVSATMNHPSVKKIKITGDTMIRAELLGFSTDTIICLDFDGEVSFIDPVKNLFITDRRAWHVRYPGDLD